jgi:Ca2+-binding RTX toxin-like protein
MDTMNIGTWLTGTVPPGWPTSMFVHGPGGSYRQFGGSGFTYSPTGIFATGTVTSIYVSDGSGGEPWGLTGFSMPVATLKSYVAAGNTAGFLGAVLAGNDTLNGHNFFAFDDYLNGYGGHDKINGGAGNDTLLGNTGNDTLEGKDGIDLLDGGAGNDRLVGGKGDDIYKIDGVADVIVELAGQGTDWVQPTISVDLTLLGDGQIVNAWLLGSANINANGNSAANVLVGNGGNNVLTGGIGNDTIVAGSGNDTLNGGAGIDEMTGGAGNDTYFADLYDTVSEAAGSGIDTVVATSDYMLTFASGDIENLTIVAGVDNFDGWGNSLANKITGNEGQNSLSGNDGNDTISGGGGADSLNGGLGNDMLNGGAGNDTVEGGHGTNTINVAEGNDTVVHQPSLDAYDIVQNFDGNPTDGQDTLSLDSMFDALGVSAVNRAGRVQSNDKGSTVDVRIDTNGDGVFEYLAATLNTPNTITIGEDVLTGS